MVKRPLGGTPIGTGRKEGQIARFTNVVLGAWLFLSAFLWAHTDVSRTSTWISGALIALVGLGAAFVVSLRWVNTLVAAWVILSPLFIDHFMIGTIVHNVVVGLVVLVVSLMPSRGNVTPEGRAAKLRS